MKNIHGWGAAMLNFVAFYSKMYISEAINRGSATSIFGIMFFAVRASDTV